MSMNDAYEKDIRAVRHVIVSASGVIAKIVPIEENRLGSECSGTTGTTGRVLTLNNTTESGGPVTIWINLTLVDPALATIVHLSSSSTVTFADPVSDTDKIRVQYHV
jgi:hypothetical protein